MKLSCLILIQLCFLIGHGTCILGRSLLLQFISYVETGQVHGGRSGLHFQFTIKHFFFHLLGQKSKYKM